MATKAFSTSGIGDGRGEREVLISAIAGGRRVRLPLLLEVRALPPVTISAPPRPPIMRSSESPVASILADKLAEVPVSSAGLAGVPLSS